MCNISGVANLKSYLESFLKGNCDYHTPTFAIKKTVSQFVLKYLPLPMKRITLIVKKITYIGVMCDVTVGTLYVKYVHYTAVLLKMDRTMLLFNNTSSRK